MALEKAPMGGEASTHFELQCMAGRLVGGQGGSRRRVSTHG